MKSVFGGPVRGHVQVELLSAYLDQQATPSERAYVDAHLQQCKECRAELDSLRRTVLLLQALPRIPVPRAFTLSEAQVGIRRPAASPGWFGGLARGLGVVAAIAVVALVAFAVFRDDRAPWNPPQTVARALPTAVPTAAPVARVVATEPIAQAAPAQPEQKTQQEAPAQSAKTAASVANAPTATSEPPQPAPMAAAPEPATAVPQPATATADTAAAPTAPENAGPPPATPEPEATTTGAAPLLAKAAPSPAVSGAAAPAEMGAAAMGRGGGGPSSPVGIPPEFLTPEPTAGARPLAETLPAGVRIAYADQKALWAIDRDGGARQLVQGRGINTPQLSPDQKWIAYRTFTDTGMRVWAIRWEGGDAKLLLDDATLPSKGLPEGYTRRAIADTRWAPKGSVLIVTLSLVPAPDNPQPPKVELWQVNVETGALQFSSELGRAWRPYYSPDGKAYLVLQYGTDDKPEGSLSLFDAKSDKGKTILTFPASVGKNSYDSQVAWAPDSKTAWVAIPVADYGTPIPPNGTKLYRVSVNGDVKEAGDIDAAQVNWAPTTAAMAYVRYVDETLAKNDLYLANADGSQPQLYAAMNQGEFISWSPKGDRFIYQDNFQVFSGAAGQAPRRMANATSMSTPRWVSDTQILASHDTGDGWVLTLRDANGDAASLMPLPREAMWDVRSSH